MSKLISKLTEIRFGSQQWSHCGFLLEDGRMIHSTVQGVEVTVPDRAFFAISVPVFYESFTEESEYPLLLNCLSYSQHKLTVWQMVRAALGLPYRSCVSFVYCALTGESQSMIKTVDDLFEMCYNSSQGGNYESRKTEGKSNLFQGTETPPSGSG